MAQIRPRLPDPGSAERPVVLLGGWKSTEVKTWAMRVCEHETGTIVVFTGDQVAVHRADSPAGQEVARRVEEQLKAANYVLLAGGPDHPTVLYRLGG